MSLSCTLPVRLAAGLLLTAVLCGGPAGCFLVGLEDEDAYDRHVNLVIPFRPSLGLDDWTVGSSSGIALARPLEVPVEVAEVLSIADDEAAEPYLDLVVQVIPKSLSYMVVGNTLDVDLLPLELYLGPGTPSPVAPAGDAETGDDLPPVLDSRFVPLLRAPGLPAGTETGEIRIDDFGPIDARLTELLTALDFALIARSGIVLEAGRTTLPAGELTISVLINIVLVARPAGLF
ncbi:MAG: hypothetical protein RBU45_25945 [Myxococcota bacterium]|jgi:hypothetical protein|nr:hypothetical protein [Myxococcota bacterium]